MTYSDKDGLFEFTDVDDDYGFDICEDMGVEALYVDEQMEFFVKWYNKANEIFLDKREQLIGGLK